MDWNAVISTFITLVVFSLFIGVPAAFYFGGQWKRVTVSQFQRGLKLRKGVLEKVLGPGRHWIYTKSTEVVAMDMRETVTTMDNLNIVAADGVPLQVSLSLTVCIDDPARAFLTTENPFQSSYAILQGSIRKRLSAVGSSEAVKLKDHISDQIQTTIRDKMSAIGMRFCAIEITEISSLRQQPQADAAFVQ